ncbi:tumor necrosis factor receptor superfamily member 14-like [Brienomyrus brachyistius]|uniref:tumor necrosis factor receptor superfamily member 14-like n=1 Tax=Brienomyrus brachyistius TaxID=42636 RepID=UPI0020B2CEF3|nr:tumor necrosis factor receptor superfamily member 14-like [Brienomyrus brachyistius]
MESRMSRNGVHWGEGWHLVDVRDWEGGLQCCVMESESQILSSVIYGYFSSAGCQIHPEDVHNMFILLQTYLVLLLLCVNYDPCSACGQAEYKIGDECCPMCSPGSRVYRHCTAWTSTSCAPCTDSTFNDQPNGLEQCSPCTVCVKGLGVKTVTACTPSSDTVCGVQEGHYCINPYKGGCRTANKHTACKPGQFIQQPGTEYTDAVCEDCSNNSYSDGSFTTCKPHTDCESRGLVTVKAGDQAADSECGEKSNIGLFAGIAAAAAVTITAGISATICIYMYRKKHGIQWQNKNPPPESENMLQNPPEVEDDDVT